MTANVALTDTFDQWRVKSNELIVMTQGDGMNNIIKTLDTTNSTSNTTGSVITAGGIAAKKSVYIGENLTVQGNVVVSGDTTISGNLIFGDAATDQVTFTADINSHIIPNANLTFNVGNTLNMWANTYTGHLGVTQKSDSGKPAVTISSTDTDQIAVDINALQVDANVIDITAAGLTTGSALAIDSDSDSTATRNIASIIQNHASATGATALYVKQDSTLAAAKFDAQTTIIIPVGTTAQRGTAVQGGIRYNSTTSSFEGYSGSSWGSLGGLIDVDQDTKIIAETSAGADNDDLDFYTAGTQRMKIDETGIVTVGVDGTGYDVIFYGDTAGRDMMWDESADALDLKDSVMINIGTGNDMQLYHDGTNSYIQNATGVLKIATETSGIALTIGHATSEVTVGDNATITGTLTGTNATFSTADNTDTLSLICTDADANAGPNLRLYRNSGSPADSDIFGQIDFEGRNDNSQDFIGARITTIAGDVSDGSEDSQIEFEVMTAGTLREYMRFASGTTPLVMFNADSQDIDFQVQSDNLTHALFVQGSDGKIGIGSATWTSDNMVQLNKAGNFGLGLNQSATGAYACSFRFQNYRNDTASTLSTMSFLWKATQVASIACISGADGSNYDDAHLIFKTAPDGTEVERIRITSAGQIGLGTATPNQVLTVEGTMSLKETASAAADTAAYGQIWIKNTAPCELYFTTDAGNDIQLTSGTGLPSSFNADQAQTFNDSGASVDFRIESNTNANMFFLDGSADKIGIGTATPSTELHVNGTITESSTINAKENITNIENIIPAIMQMRGVKFDWKEKNKGIDNYGLIAEEVEEILPNIVSYDPITGNPSGIQYTKFTAVLLEAIKEQQGQINDLRSRLIS